MQTGFHDIISTTVRYAKLSNSLLWADEVADRIADATPVSVNRAIIADELTAAAVREGVPVRVPRDRSRRRTPGSRASR